MLTDNSAEIRKRILLVNKVFRDYTI